MLSLRRTQAPDIWDPADRPLRECEALVGRERERAIIEAAVDDALTGRGNLVLLGGDSGIGKTRLAAEACARAERGGARTVWGRCWEDAGTPAFWPWVQVARALSPHGEVDVRFGADTLETPHDRFALFDSFAHDLVEIAADGPLVVVVDDLHAADEASVMLLRFLHHHVRDRPALLLGTYRPVELHQRPAIEELVDQAAAESIVLSLEPLSEQETAGLIARLAPGVAPDVASRVFALTQGNPLFVREVAGLVATGRTIEDIDRLPPGIRSRVASRFRLLSKETQRVVCIAATIGCEVEFGTLARVSDLSDEVLADLLVEAEATRVLVPADSPGAYRFAHGLVRHSIYEGIDPALRCELHHLVGEALESGMTPTTAAELAYHFSHGAPGSDAAKAFVYGRWAGDEAMNALGYEQAAAHYLSAASIAAAGGVDAADRYAVLMALGTARARSADRQGARAALLQAAALGRRLGSPPLVADALVGVPTGFTGVGPRSGEVDRELVAGLRGVLGQLGPDEAVRRSRLQARLALGTFWGMSPAESQRATAAAVAEARRTGDAAALAVALYADRAVHTGPQHTERRLAMANEVIELAERHGDQLLALRGRIGRVVDHLELGDLCSVDADVAAVDRAARTINDTCARWHVATWRAMRALLEGRFDDAEAASDQALALAMRTGDADAIECFGVQRITQYWSQGRLDEVDELLGVGVDRDPPLPAWRCALASFHADAGRIDEARREFGVLAADGFVGIPRDHDWTIAMASLARACLFLGDSRRAELLYELLAPFGDRFVVVGPGILWSGPVDHSLGLLAATMGRLDAAVGHLESAIERCNRLGAPGYAAEAQRRLAEVLVGRNRRGDHERARSLLAAARPTFDRLGMCVDAATTAARLAHLGGHPSAEERQERALATPAPAPALVSSPSPVVARLSREGDCWRVSYGGHDARLKDAVGLRYLAALLATPGQDVLALDLASRGRPTTTSTARAGEAVGGREPDDAGAILDDRAKAAYRARISELQSEVDDDAVDPERKAVARHELESIADHLAAALGIGGRDRKACSVAERARLSVTKAIRYSIRRIGDRHPELGHHLAVAVRTGTYCRYDPGPGGAPDWRIEPDAGPRGLRRTTNGAGLLTG